MQPNVCFFLFFLDGDDMSNLLVPDIIKEMAEFVIVTNGLRTKIEGIDENTYPLLSAY